MEKPNHEPDMNIKVAAFTVSEKSASTCIKISLCIYTPRLPPDIVLIYLLLILSST